MADERTVTIVNLYGVVAVRHELAIRVDFTPLTRWDKFSAAAREQWNYVVAPSLVVAVVVAALRVAIGVL